MKISSIRLTKFNNGDAWDKETIGQVYVSRTSSTVAISTNYMYTHISDQFTNPEAMRLCHLLKQRKHSKQPIDDIIINLRDDGHIKWLNNFKYTQSRVSKKEDYAKIEEFGKF